MSIVTRKGDQGVTALMYNRRVSKSHPRVEAYGTVDELNAALGMARATARRAFLDDALAATQKDLVIVMGELATQVEDLQRYRADKYPVVTSSMTQRLDALAARIEAEKISFKGWATPGDSPVSAALELARAICRRAERRVCALQESDQLRNPEIIIYLNRLSDCLWLLARWSETKSVRRSASRRRS